MSADCPFCSSYFWYRVYVPKVIQWVDGQKVIPPGARSMFVFRCDNCHYTEEDIEQTKALDQENDL